MKIAIIGAGINGLYLAWKLSEKGHNVTVFEKKDKIGQEVCSGLFSQRILELIPLSAGLIQNKINFVLLHFPRKIITVKFSKDFFVMSHFELDILVADLAQKAGAKIILNSNISQLPQGYDKIIGCDGANSFIRRNLGIKEPKYRLGILGLATENCSQRTVLREQFSVKAWPCKEGFIWRIPHSKEVEYGIITKSKDARRIFEGFLQKNSIVLNNIRSRTVPQGFQIPSNLSITLCGDAAGLTKPWSGGGVIWGLTAAEILLKTFPDFLKYKRAIKRFFIPKIIFSKTAVKLIYFLGNKMPWVLPKKIRMESDFLL